MREHEQQENHLSSYSSWCMFMGQKCTTASCSWTTTSKLPTRWKYYLRGKCNLASNMSVPFPQWPLPLWRRQSLPEHDFPFFSLKNMPEAVVLVVISCLLLGLARTISMLYTFSCSYAFWKLLKLFLPCSGFFSLPDFFFLELYIPSVPSLLLSVDIWFISLYWLGCNKNNQLLWNSFAWVWPWVSHILMHRIHSSYYVSSAMTPAPGLAWCFWSWSVIQLLELDFLVSFGWAIDSHCSMNEAGSYVLIWHLRFPFWNVWV